jgi:hypothetical protein
MENLNIDYNLHPAVPKTPDDFVKMAEARLAEGWPIYVPVVFPGVDDNGHPYVRNFPVLRIKESEHGYECVLQGWGTAEIQAGTPFHFISPRK